MAIYTHLESRFIRLLKLHPGEHDDPITCDMVACCLDDVPCPEYVALSYTWGCESQGFDVKVNNAIIPIRQNLFYALRQIRCIQGRVDAVTSGSFWWIDSICINQEDGREKERQVAMMGHIYERSKLTLVYLGELDSDGVLAMEMLHRLSICQKEESRALLRQGTEGELNALATFFRRPWWTRAWTTQEYVLPDRLIFLCGNRDIPRRDFTRALNRLGRYNRLLQEYQSVHLASGFIMASKRKKILDRRYDILQGVGHTPRLTLCDFLVYAGGSASSRKRDCVFSALGLVLDSDDFRLNPHYDNRRSVDIFEELIRAHIMSSECLDIICFADASPRDETTQCPSWVPYWPNHKAQASDHLAWQSFPALASRRHTKNQGNDRGINKAVYKASGNIPPAITTNFQPGALLCHAIILEKIRQLGGSFPAEERNEITSLRGSESRLEISSGILAPDGPYDRNFDEVWRKRALEYKPPESLWKTIVLNRRDSFLDSIAPRDYETDFKWLLHRAIQDPSQLKSKTLHWIRHNARILFGSQTYATDIFKRLHSTPGCDKISSHFESQLYHAWINMRKKLLVTDNQTYGMACEGAMIEDIICVLAGCNFPIIIRETERSGYYRLVGECYLEGVMEGELFQRPGETTQWTTIHLI
ncbi:heterokaryon incompatibility protein-domain-containing protein [Xylaria scruposa]|nr:heterokaryon incompatibility protein-domain-containing protein [Xylaria scruposa]